jgi:glyoxylase-like metal-dependent hydrolase (beta-lactamase superfamily II)
VPLVHPRYLEIDQLVEEVGRHLVIHGVPPAEAEYMKNVSRGLREFVRPAMPVLQLDGSETLAMGGQPMRIDWTPGHSPGHVCVFDPKRRVLFGGDQLLPGTSPNIALHPQSTPNPLDDYLAGLDRVLALDPLVVLPSHGRPIEHAGRLVDGLKAHHERRKERMLGVIGDGELSAWEVATAVWGRRENLFEMRMALQEGLAHLQSLSREGRLTKQAEPGRVRWRRSPASTV